MSAYLVAQGPVVIDSVMVIRSAMTDKAAIVFLVRMSPIVIAHRAILALAIEKQPVRQVVIVTSIVIIALVIFLSHVKQTVRVIHIVPEIVHAIRPIHVMAGVAVIRTVPVEHVHAIRQPPVRRIALAIVTALQPLLVPAIQPMTVMQIVMHAILNVPAYVMRPLTVKEIALAISIAQEMPIVPVT